MKIRHMKVFVSVNFRTYGQRTLKKHRIYIYEKN